MRQRILGSYTPPCHRRMVITTQFNVSSCCTRALTSSGGFLGGGGGCPACYFCAMHQFFVRPSQCKGQTKNQQIQTIIVQLAPTTITRYPGKTNYCLKSNPPPL